MRYLRRAAACAVVGVLCLGVGSPAQAAAQSSGKVKLLPATKRIGGLTGGDLLGEQWHQWLELPPENNSFLLNGDLCMSAGHKGKILMGVHSPVEPTVCTVKPGTPVFFSTYSAECSTVEPPPFFGATEADQQACAIEALAGFIPDAILVSVDGADPVDSSLRSSSASRRSERPSSRRTAFSIPTRSTSRPERRPFRRPGTLSYYGRCLPADTRSQCST